MAFGRRKKDKADSIDDAAVQGDAEDTQVDGADDLTSEQDTAAGPGTPRADGTDGPFDSRHAPTEIPAEWGRIDLGSLILTVPSGVELRFDANQETSAVNSVVVVLDDMAVQVMGYAAPRSLGIWDEVRGDIAGQLGSGGGSANEVDGRFGPELHAHVPTDDGLLEARFMGIDGPRWFLRGVISGPGAHDDLTVERALEVFAGTVVVRDDEARPSQEPLPVSLPQQDGSGQLVIDTPESADAADVADAEVDPLKPFERGPEITEIR